MIDIEFMVQYLVLLHASQYPELTADIGNIALLKLLGQLDFIESSLAERVADAYRYFRKIQHQIRLKGADKARVDMTPSVELLRKAVNQLWLHVMEQPTK